MKRLIYKIAIGITFLFCLILLAIHIWIGQSVKEKIEIAKAQYTGTTEDALIAYFIDENQSTTDRTHNAIWTLGQIRSEKALPILKELYKNDPKGDTCYGKHDSLLCQYEIYKAIVAIERGWLFSHARLNK